VFEKLVWQFHKDKNEIISDDMSLLSDINDANQNVKNFSCHYLLLKVKRNIFDASFVFGVLLGDGYD